MKASVEVGVANNPTHPRKHRRVMTPQRTTMGTTLLYAEASGAGLSAGTDQDNTESESTADNTTLHRTSAHCSYPRKAIS